LEDERAVVREELDLGIRNARLRRGGEARVDIAVKGGRIVAIGEGVGASARETIDAEGGLVTESFVNPHLHLCKAWTLPMMSEAALAAYHGADMGKALGAIDMASAIKAKYDAAWITPNARRAVALAALHGVLHIRAFADVDSKARLEGVKALIAVREEFCGIVDIQVVAFAQDGIVKEPGAERLMEEAMALGADVVGGIPWIEFTDDDARAHVAFCFDLAAKHDADVSMLLDDAGDPSLRTLEIFATETLKRGWSGRALAHHCRAMALYPAPYLQRLAGVLRKAEISVVTDPHTGPLHARVRDLIDEGIDVCLGQDDISDAYYPFGRNNMLEVAFLAAHLLWMTGRDDIERLYDMATVAGGKAMNLPNHVLAVGAEANLVVLGESDVVEALRFHAAPRHVVSHGRRVDLTRMQALAQETDGTAGNLFENSAAKLRSRRVESAPAARQWGAGDPAPSV
jgi:cytosine/creatinine deaminase